MTNAYYMYTKGASYAKGTTTPLPSKKGMLYVDAVLDDWVSPTQELSENAYFLRMSNMDIKTYAPLPTDSVRGVEQALETQEHIKTDPSEIKSEVEAMQ